MKSISWLLFEKEHGFLRECPTCGFSTCSPSTYRRHSRHCNASNAAEENTQTTNNTTLVNNVPDIGSTASTDLSSVESILPANDSASPSVDFPSVSSKPTVGFSPISCQSSVVGSQSLLSDSPVVSEASDQFDHRTDQFDHSSDQLDHSSDEAAVEAGVSVSLDEGRSAVRNLSFELQQLTRELTSDCLLSTPSMMLAARDVDLPSVSAQSPSDSVLARDAAAAESVAMTTETCCDVAARDAAADSVAMTTETCCDAAERSLSMNVSDAQLKDSDKKMLTLTHETICDTENNVTDSSALLTDESHSAGTEDDCDEVKDSSLEADGNCDVKDTAVDDEDGLNTSPTVTSSKKPRHSRKMSKQRRCKHCTSVLSSRLDRRIHMQSQHPDMIPVFRCTDCNYCSVEHKNYERHLLRHLLAGPFRCTQCSFSSTSQSSIKRHVTLQHSSRSNKSHDNVGSSEIPLKVSSKVPLPTSSRVVDGGKSKDFPCAIPLSSSEPVCDANDGEKLDSCECADDAGSSCHGCRNSTDADDTETEADVNGTAVVSNAVTPETSVDMIQSVIEVEVRNCRSEETGVPEAWWTCLACGCRYNERAKVRRHVKCKHLVPLTECSVRDLRATPANDLCVTPASHTAVNDLSTILQQARAEPVTSSDDKPSVRAEPSNVDTSDLSSGGKLQPKSSFVKIAPKPIPLDEIAPKPIRLDGSHQVFTAPSTLISCRRQIVLPKRNWKQMSLTVHPANSPLATLAAAADKDAGTCDTQESELKRHLTCVDNKQPRAADGSEKEPLTREVPRKRQRLILPAKPNKLILERCRSIKTESLDSAKQTSSALACSSTVLSEHGRRDEFNENCSTQEDTTSGEPLDKVSESNDEELAKSSEVKRQLGIKRTSSLKCAHCQFTASRLPDLRRHLLEHTNDTVYECGRCGRSFRNKIGLYLHEQRKHKAELSQHSDTPQTPPPPVDETGPAAEDVEQTSAEAQKPDNNTDKLMSKKKRKQNKFLGSELRQKLDDPATFESGEEQGKSSNHRSSTNVDGKDGKKKERSASKQCTETVEMVQSTGESDHFKIVIRRQSSVGEEILETIAGVNDGMMCRYCCYVAKIPAQLTQHMKIHTGERDYWCTVGNCIYKTIWRCDMKKHFKKFHPDEVERHGGNYYDILKHCYRPSKLADNADSSVSVDSSSTRVNVFKMSKRQRRRLLKLKNKERSTEEMTADNESKEGADSAVKSSFVKIAPKRVERKGGRHMSAVSPSSVQTDANKPPSDSEAKKGPVKLMERFRPYKCSECGRRSNWRWDLKKHIEAVHRKGAVIIKLTDDVARATFADIYSSQGGRNGVRFPRRSTADSVPAGGKAESETKCNVAAGNSQTDDADNKKPVLELEKTLARAPAPVKSIGMIDMLQLKRFQCSACPYRSNHRGDLGRHVRMRHGRGNCTINVLSADIAAATLHAYKLQWNRKKAWMPKSDSQTTNTDPVKLHHGRKEDTEENVDEVDEEVEKSGAESQSVDDGGSRKQHHKDLWYLDDGRDETKCCDICPFKTDRTGLLELHKLRHRASSAVAFSCPHCPYFVRTSRQLERHMALHEDSVQPHHEHLLDCAGVQHTSHCGLAKNRYVCEKCPFVSLVRNEFWLHRRHHFVPKVDVPYVCDLCSFWASDRRTMLEHSILHTQSYYPRLSTPVISRYRPTSADAAGRECYSGNVTGREVEMEIVEDVPSKKMLRADDEMELESCPQLEAVAELVSAASETDLSDCCPLLERECLPSPLEPADTPESIVVKPVPADSRESGMDSGELVVCPALCAESASSCGPGDLMTSDCSEAGSAECGHVELCSSLDAVETSSADVVTSHTEDESDALKDESMSAADETVASRVSDCPPPSLSAGSTAPDSQTSDNGDVSLKDNEADVCNETRLQLQADVSSWPAVCSSNAGVGTSRLSRDRALSRVDVDHSDNSDLLTTTMPRQTTTVTNTPNTQALDADGACDDVLEGVRDAADAGMMAADHSENGKLHGKDGVSNQETSNDFAADGKVSSESWTDGKCTCTLQCPFCFFTIASVRLLRQHVVFHVAVSDAVRTTVFHPELNDVEDGRMDDERCDGIIQLCKQCQRLAELDNADHSAVPPSCGPLTQRLSSQSDCDLVSELELGDKVSFLSKLSLCCVV